MKLANKKNLKNPWIAALLNFLFYGAGYLYAGKKKALGWGLVVVFIAMTIEFFLGSINHIRDPISTHTISTTLLSFVVAYDIYKIVKIKKNDEEKK